MKKKEKDEQIFQALRNFAEEKLNTLPLKVRYAFVTELLGLILEGKRDESLKLFLAFLKGEHQPSLEEE